MNLKKKSSRNSYKEETPTPLKTESESENQAVTKPLSSSLFIYSKPSQETQITKEVLLTENNIQDTNFNIL